MFLSLNIAPTSAGVVWMRTFHLLLSFASLLALVTTKLVHFLISSNHPAAGLPRLLFPSTIPSKMFFSKHGCLMMCPKYPSFLSAIAALIVSSKNPLFKNPFVYFDLKSVQGTPETRRSAGSTITQMISLGLPTILFHNTAPTLSYCRYQSRHSEFPKAQA